MLDQIEGFILAGGLSRRMGTDKSQLQLNDQKFVDRIANSIRNLTDSVKVVGGRVQDSKLKTVPDVYPNWGALGGLHAALNNCSRDWSLVVACDLPFVTPELFSRLFEFTRGHDAVIPIQADSRPQPLCGFYRTNPCRRIATDLINQGLRRPLDLLEAVNTCQVEFSKLEQLTQSRMFFVNINTPQDYDEAIRAAVLAEEQVGP